jgi:hypothetical protein
MGVVEACDLLEETVFYSTRANPKGFKPGTPLSLSYVVKYDNITFAMR